MAISPDLPGVSIALTINNQPLPEQDMPDPDHVERTVDRLVEAQSGQIFEVQMTVDPTTCFWGSDLAFNIFVDGTQIEDIFVPAGVVNIGFPFTETSEGSYSSVDRVRKYHFADVVAVEALSHSITSRSSSVREAWETSLSSEVTMSRPRGRPMPSTASSGYDAMASASTTMTIDHSDILTPATTMTTDHSDILTPTTTMTIDHSDMMMPTTSYAPQVSPYSGGPTSRSNTHTPRELLDLGTIKVKVRHINRKEPVSFGPGGVAGRRIGNRTGQEALKRGIGRRVGFTEPMKTTAVTTLSSEDVPDVPNPVATFVFHYRSKEGLESMRAAVAALVPGSDAKGVGKGAVKMQLDGTSFESGKDAVKQEWDGTSFESGKDAVKQEWDGTSKLEPVTEKSKQYKQEPNSSEAAIKEESTRQGPIRFFSGLEREDDGFDTQDEDDESLNFGIKIEDSRDFEDFNDV